MHWLKWIVEFIFGCHHWRTTWPHRDRQGFDYVCCLDCGKELPYSVRLMRIVSREELVEERSLAVGAGLRAAQRRGVDPNPAKVLAFPKKDDRGPFPTSSAVISRSR
jgi:hypothetical protein